MKRLIVLFGVLLSGCVNETTTVEQEPVNDSKASRRVFNIRMRGNIGEHPLELVEIDGCEYFVSKVHGGISPTHKGNCKFCLERR